MVIDAVRYNKHRYQFSITKHFVKQKISLKMALISINTDEGQTSEQKHNIDEETRMWLAKNKLNKLISTFAEDDITLDDLVLFQPSDIETFANELKLSTILKVRLRSAMRELIADYATQTQKDEWDMDSTTQYTQKNKEFKVKLDKKTGVVTLINTENCCDKAGIMGTVVVRKGHIRVWKLRVISIAQKHQYFESYIGIKSIDPDTAKRANIAHLSSAANYGTLSQHSNDDKYLMSMGLLLNDLSVYDQDDLTKNINTGDLIELKLNLKQGMFSMKVNDNQETIIWKWKELMDDLAYKLYFNTDCSADGNTIQLL
eukprot:1070321_1